MSNISTAGTNSLVQEISIVWSIEDVLDVRPLLSKEQASIVLQHLKKNHDATIGINWDVIEIVSDDLFLKSIRVIKTLRYKEHEIEISYQEFDERYIADIRIDDCDGHTVQGFCGLNTESEAVSVAQAFIDGLHYTEEEEE
ncbi:TPA: hypothetical protein ACPSKY_002908 [Legionella bozemanae]